MSRDISRKGHRVVLVTGCAGFIGSNLVAYLLERGYRVKGVDNLSNGRMENIFPSLHSPEFEFIQGDLRDYSLCQRLCAKVDTVLHQAAMGSVPRSVATPLITHSNNVTAFQNLIEAARLAGVRRFVFASSSSVYGDSQSMPKREATIGQALSPYAVSKRTGELYGMVYHRVYGMQTIGMRYFNVFGPNQSPEGAYAAVIPLMFKSLLERGAFTVNGNGEQSRDFTFVENVLAANLLAMSVSDERAYGRVFNIAAGGKTSLNRLLEMAKARVLSRGIDIGNWRPEYGPERLGDVRNSTADISMANEILGYSPKISLEDGLDRTLDFYMGSGSSRLKASA